MVFDFFDGSRSIATHWRRGREYVTFTCCNDDDDDDDDDDDLQQQERWQTREARWWEEEVLKLLTITNKVFLQYVYSHISHFHKWRITAYPYPYPYRVSCDLEKTIVG